MFDQRTMTLQSVHFGRHSESYHVSSHANHYKSDTSFSRPPSSCYYYQYSPKVSQFHSKIERSLSLPMENPSSLSLQLTPRGNREDDEEKHQKAPQPHPSLHSVRKPPPKPWRRPDLPPPPKVYRVEPRGFRQLVQRLTGKLQSTPRPLKDTVSPPPPIELAPPALAPPHLDFDHSVIQMPYKTNVFGHQSMELLSPSVYSSWCSFPLLSPRSLAAIEHSNSSTVL